MFTTPRVYSQPEEEYEELPLQGSSSYNPLNYVPTTGSILNGFTRVQQSILKLSPSRIGAMQTSLATVPEASEEGSDRQSVSTTTEDTAVVEARTPSKFTAHSIHEVRRIRPVEVAPDDPFIDTSTVTSPSRDPRSIAYRFASAVYKDGAVTVTPPRPVSQFSNGTGVYTSGASRSPTPSRPSTVYRRVVDEEQPPPQGERDTDDDGEYEDEDEDEEDEDIEDEDLVDAYLGPYTFSDSEKMSLTSTTSSTLDGCPTSPQTTRHFGPAPAGRVHRRNQMMKFKKAVRLTNGNLVVDLDCPPKLIKVLPTLSMRNSERGEMTRTRYTAVTGDPDDFAKQGFFLRQNEIGRTTELFVVITMYNVRLRCPGLRPESANPPT